MEWLATLIIFQRLKKSKHREEAWHMNNPAAIVARRMVGEFDTDAGELGEAEYLTKIDLIIRWLIANPPDNALTSTDEPKP